MLFQRGLDRVKVVAAASARPAGIQVAGAWVLGMVAGLALLAVWPRLFEKEGVVEHLTHAVLLIALGVSLARRGRVARGARVMLVIAVATFLLEETDWGLVYWRFWMPSAPQEMNLHSSAPGQLLVGAFLLGVPVGGALRACASPTQVWGPFARHDLWALGALGATYALSLWAAHRMGAYVTFEPAYQEWADLGLATLFAIQAHRMQAPKRAILQLQAT